MTGVRANIKSFREAACECGRLLAGREGASLFEKLRAMIDIAHAFMRPGSCERLFVQLSCSQGCALLTLAVVPWLTSLGLQGGNNRT
jgi:hypothetical protein